MKEKTIIFLDASALKNSSCLLRLFRDTVMGYGQKIQNNDIVWGSAFHKFRAHFRETGNAMFAMKLALSYLDTTPMFVKPNKKYLTKGFLTQACLAYEDKYTDDKELIPYKYDNVTFIEPVTRFAFPFIITDEVELHIAGTMDEVAHYKGGHFGGGDCTVITDCKTSGVWKIREYLHSYRLSTQFLMYRWAIRKYAQFRPGSIWAKIDGEKLGCIVDGVFHSSKDEEGDKNANVKLTRSEKPIFFKDKMVDDFELLVTKKAQELVEAVTHWRNTGQEPIRQGLINDSCNTKFGDCKYVDVCAAVDNEERQANLEIFHTSFYNPLMFGE